MELFSLPPSCLPHRHPPFFRVAPCYVDLRIPRGFLQLLVKRRPKKGFPQIPPPRQSHSICRRADARPTRRPGRRRLVARFFRRLWVSPMNVALARSPSLLWLSIFCAGGGCGGRTNGPGQGASAVFDGGGSTGSISATASEASAAVDAQTADPWFDPALMPPTPLDGAPIADESWADDAPTDEDASCETLTSDACIRCCALGNASGKAELDLVGHSCMCTSCDALCTAATCTMNGFPQGACTACIKDGLKNACAKNGYLNQLCAPDHECGRYVACLMACL